MVKKLAVKTSYRSSVSDGAFLKNLLGWNILTGSISNENYDVLLIGEGEPISPELYNDEKLIEFNTNFQRDSSDTNYIVSAIKQNKKIIAFGRSAHLVCCLAGGLVIQRLHGHRELTHDGKTKITHHEIFDTLKLLNPKHSSAWPSAHFQMMYPFLIPREEYSIIAHALSESLIKTSTLSGMKVKPYYANMKFDLTPPTEIDFLKGGVHSSHSNNHDVIEPEIVYFRNLNALCFECDPNTIKDIHLKAYVRRIIDLFIQNKL